MIVYTLGFSLHGGLVILLLSNTQMKRVILCKPCYMSINFLGRLLSLVMRYFGVVVMHRNGEKAKRILRLVEWYAIIQDKL